MPLPVSLSKVADEMDLPNEDWEAYIHRQTGELITLTGDEEDEELLPAEAFEAIESGSEDYIALPSRFDIHEYDIMRRFAESLEDRTLSEDLAITLRGSGAFGRFKDMVHHHGIQDRWYAFRAEALESIAADFLDEHGIAYTRG